MALEVRATAGDVAQTPLFPVAFDLECAVEQAEQDLACLSFERVRLGVFPGLAHQAAVGVREVQPQFT